MDALIVQVPQEIREQLDARARTEGKDAQAIALEILRRDLGAPEEKTETPAPAETPARYLTVEERYDRAYKKMRERGLIVPLSDELRQQIGNPPSIEQVREVLSKAGGKPLSQIVIEQRQERHDIQVYGYRKVNAKSS